MSKQGYIKLHRKIVDWEWYDDLNTFKLWIHLLLKVNHEDKKWRGELVKRGSCISSYQSLSAETGLTVQQVRTSLNKLIETNDITKLSRTKNTLFIVTNYNMYQDSQQTDEQTNNMQDNKQSTNNQQTSNKQVTTNKNDKNVKNDKNEKKKESKHTHGLYKHVRLTDSEYEKLKHDFPFYQDLITKLDEYIETSGKTYKNHNLVLRGWVLKWYKENHKIDDLVENETFNEPIENKIVDSDLSELLNKFKNGEIQ